MRIYPLVLAAIVYGVGVALFVHDRGVALFGPDSTLDSPAAVVGILFMVNGLITVTPTILAPMVTLSAEIVYYILAPLLLRLRFESVIALLFASLIFYLFLVDFSKHDHIIGFERHGHRAMAMLCFWLLGFLAYRKRGNLTLGFLGIGGGLLLLLYARPLFDGIGSFVTYGVSAFCVCCLPALAMPRALVRPANYLGELSYPLYLFHYPTMYLGAQLARHWSQAVTVAACWSLSLAVSVLAYHLVDVPIRKRRHHPRQL